MTNNVIDIFSGKPVGESVTEFIVRLLPETDGLCLLHSFYLQDEQLTIIPIVCWALLKDGSVAAMVPWKGSLRICLEFDNPELGYFHGFYDPVLDSISDAPPLHKAVCLNAMAEHFKEHHLLRNDGIVQEIPDIIGTHALMVDEDFSNLTIAEVLSWQLLGNGQVRGMLADYEKVVVGPVLMGDECLYSVEEHPRFRLYLQHHIANQIKLRDPEAIADITRLLDEQS